MKFLPFALLWFAASALADNPPLSERVFNGPSGSTKVGTLCSAQTATSTGCTGSVNGVSDQLVADVRGYTTVVIYTTQATATTYTCDVYTSDNGYDLDTGVGQDRSTTALTETQQAIVLDGALGFIWVECSAIGDNSVTASFVATQ